MKDTVGYFELEELTSGRWKVKNTKTGFEHVTYGSSEEVREQAEAQTEAWERKALSKGKPQRGAAWRKTMTDPSKQKAT